MSYWNMNLNELDAVQAMFRAEVNMRLFGIGGWVAATCVLWNINQIRRMLG